MNDKNNRALAVGALLVALVLVAAIWFLAVSPRLSAAQTSNAATENQRNQNDLLELQLAARQRDATQIPQLEEELHGIREILPPYEGTADLRRMVDKIAAKAGVLVVSDQVATAVPVVGGITLAPQAAAVGMVADYAADWLFTTLHATPYTLELSGSLDAILQVIDELQLGDHRYFLLTTMTIVQEAGEDGLPGSFTATLGGHIFTLDYGVADITLPPEEAPWPGPEGEEVMPPDEVENPFTVLTANSGA